MKPEAKIKFPDRVKCNKPIGNAICAALST